MLVCSFVDLGLETCVKRFNHFFNLARQIEKNYCDGKLVGNLRRQICPETWVKHLNNFFLIWHAMLVATFNYNALYVRRPNKYKSMQYIQPKILEF